MDNIKQIKEIKADIKAKEKQLKELNSQEEDIRKQINKVGNERLKLIREIEKLDFNNVVHAGDTFLYKYKDVGYHGDEAVLYDILNAEAPWVIVRETRKRRDDEVISIIITHYSTSNLAYFREAKLISRDEYNKIREEWINL